MPKTPSVILREELRKHGYELLDVYSYREYDVIRVLNKQTGTVGLYKTKKKVNTLTNKEDINLLISELGKKH